MGPVDDRIADLASHQHGAVTRAQLLTEGVPSSAIQRRVKSGLLRRVHPGVYVRVESRDPFRAEAAALLACGQAAALSHASAGAIRDLASPLPPQAPVHVIAPYRIRMTGIVAHQHRLHPDEVICLEGLRQTTVARTLVDLAPVLQARDLERAVARALDRGLISPDELGALPGRYAGYAGIATLRAILTAAVALTRSRAEEWVLSLVRSSGLPRPHTNVRVCGLEVDFLWRDARTVVEVDGYEYHRSRKAFERDRERDARLGAAGYRVMRVTWRQVTETPTKVLVRLAQVLARSADGGA